MNKYCNIISYPCKQTTESEDYYIVGRTHRGGRFYSEDMSYTEALKLIKTYYSIVDYFGGGVVELVKADQIQLKYNVD